MLNELTSKQISEWKAYAGIEPFGSDTDWLRTGIVASTIANVNRSKKSSKLFKPEDFMPPKPKITRAKQSLEEQKTVLQGLFAWAKKFKKTKRKSHGHNR